MKSYNSKQESKHIIYLEANDLYVYAISKFLPTSGLKWIDPKVLTWINISTIAPKEAF